jgi:hypothetical protein
MGIIGLSSALALLADAGFECGARSKQSLLVGLLVLSACREDKPDGLCTEADAGFQIAAIPLTETDSTGKPWPSYSEDLEAARANCSEYRVSIATCSNGKRYIARDGGLSGGTTYFLGERLVGFSDWGDLIQCECEPGHAPVCTAGAAAGDVSCPDPSETMLCGPYVDVDAGLSALRP